MAFECEISHDILQRIMAQSEKNSSDLQCWLLATANSYASEENPGLLIIDDTALSKPFATVLENLGHVYDSANEREIKGYTLVVICWTNQEITIPVSFGFYIPKNVEHKGPHKTKLEIAQELIAELKGFILFKHILLDGLYASNDMMSFLEKNGLIYFMRLPRNRIVTFDGDVMGFKVANHYRFKLTRNKRSAVFKVKLNGVYRYVTVQKRKQANNTYQTVYIVSNQECSSLETILMYAIRWMIEKFFRTAKQTLGLNDCQTHTLNRQKLHIYSIFAAYSILEIIKFNHKFKCPEDAKRLIVDSKMNLTHIAKLAIDQYSYASA